MSSFIFNSFKERFLKSEVPENDTWFFKPVNSKFKENFETDDIKLENYRTYNDFNMAAISKGKKIDETFAKMSKFTYDYYKESNDDTAVKPPFVTVENINKVISANRFNKNITNLRILFFPTADDIKINGSQAGLFSKFLTKESNYGFYYVKSKEELAWCANRVNGDTEGSSERGNIFNNHINIVLGDNIGEEKVYTKISHQIGKYEDRPFEGLFFGFGFNFINVEIECNSNANGIIGYNGKNGRINNVYFKNTRGKATRLICKKKINIPHMTKDSCDINAALFVGCNYGTVELCRVEGENVGDKARVEISKFVPSVYLVQNKSEDTSKPILDDGDEKNYNTNVFYPNYFCINSPGNIIPYCGYFNEGIYGTVSSKDGTRKFWNLNGNNYDATNIKSISILGNPKNGLDAVACLYDYPAHKLTHDQVESSNEFDVSDKNLGILGILSNDVSNNSNELKNVPFFDKSIRPHEFNRVAYYVSLLVGTNYGNIYENKCNAEVYFMGTFVGFEGGICGKLACGDIKNNYIKQDIYDNGGNRDWFVSTAQEDFSNQTEVIKLQLQNTDRSTTNPITNRKLEDHNGIYLNLKTLKNCAIKGIEYTVSGNSNMNPQTENIKTAFGSFVIDNCYNSFSLTNKKDKLITYKDKNSDKTLSGYISLTAEKLYEYRNISGANFYNSQNPVNYEDYNLELNFFNDVSSVYLTSDRYNKSSLSNSYFDISAIPNGNIIIEKGEKKTRYTVNRKFKFPVVRTFSGVNENHYNPTNFTLKYNNNTYFVNQGFPGPTNIYAPFFNYVTTDGLVFESVANENENDYAFISGYNATSGFINADLLKVVSAANVKYHNIWYDPYNTTDYTKLKYKHEIIDLGDIKEGSYNTFGIYSRNEGNMWYEKTSGYGYTPLHDGNKSYSQLYQRFYLPKKDFTKSYIAELKSIYNVGGLCGMHAYGLSTNIQNNKIYLDNNIPVYLNTTSTGDDLNYNGMKDYGALNRFGGFAAVSEIRTSLMCTDFAESNRTINITNNYFKYNEDIHGNSYVTGVLTRKVGPYSCGTGAVHNLGTASPLIAEVKPIIRKTPGIQSYITTFTVDDEKAKGSTDVTYNKKTQYSNDLAMICPRKNPNGFAIDLQVESFVNRQMDYMNNNYTKVGVYPMDYRNIMSTMYDWNTNIIQKMPYGVCSSDPCAMTTVNNHAMSEITIDEIYTSPKQIGKYSYYGTTFTLGHDPYGNPRYFNDVTRMFDTGYRGTNIDDSTVFKMPKDNITPKIDNEEKYNIFTYTRGEMKETAFTGMSYNVQFGFSDNKDILGYWLQDPKHSGYKGQSGYNYDGSVIHIGETYNPQAIREMISTSKKGIAKVSSVSAEDFQGLYVYDKNGNNVMYIDTQYGDMDELNSWSMQLKKNKNNKDHSDLSGCILEIG